MPNGQNVSMTLETKSPVVLANTPTKAIVTFAALLALKLSPIGTSRWTWTGRLLGLSTLTKVFKSLLTGPSTTSSVPAVVTRKRRHHESAAGDTCRHEACPPEPPKRRRLTEGPAVEATTTVSTSPTGTPGEAMPEMQSSSRAPFLQGSPEVSGATMMQSISVTGCTAVKAMPWDRTVRGHWAREGRRHGWTRLWTDFK